MLHGSIHKKTIEYVPVGLILVDLVADLPECCRPCRPVQVVVLVEPVAQHSSPRFGFTDLYTLAPPALLAVEDGECGPADRATGSTTDGSYGVGLDEADQESRRIEKEKVEGM